MQIYLDYGATTPICQPAINRMGQVMQEHWGNPSSIHEWGKRAAMVVEEARMQVAQLINAPLTSIIFTSGGTEADNLAIFGITRQSHHPGHIITSGVEHPAIAEPVRALMKQGWRVTQLPVDPQGRVDPTHLQAALQPDTVLVSIVYGQSEVGTLQPIEQLGQITRSHGALFHTDAVQAVGRVPIDVQQLPIDLLSFSSHKLYGPQGVGGLYVRPGVRLFPLLLGGGQEFQCRSGTQAVAAIAGFGMAAQLARENLVAESLRLRSLRDLLFDRLAHHPQLIPTGDRSHRLPHHVSFCLIPLHDQHSFTGKALVHQMNLAGIAISAGSACQSGKTMPSSVLLAMGYPEAIAKGAIRLTLGSHTTVADIDWTVMVMEQILTSSQRL